MIDKNTPKPVFRAMNIIRKDSRRSGWFTMRHPEQPDEMALQSASITTPAQRESIREKQHRG